MGIFSMMNTSDMNFRRTDEYIGDASTESRGRCKPVWNARWKMVREEPPASQKAASVQTFDKPAA
ncbi:hypothetical protein D3C73_1296930 [compost metagenome]